MYYYDNVSNSAWTYACQYKAEYERIPGTMFEYIWWSTCSA